MLCVAAMQAGAQCNDCVARPSVVRHDSCDVKSTCCSESVSPSTLIIWYDATSKRNKKRLMKAVKAYKAEVIYDYNNFNGIAIKIPQNTSIDAAIAYFKKVKGVVQVNRDGVMHLD